MEILGIDIGGSGIKGAIVDVDLGVMLTDRYRIPTPSPATPDEVTSTVAEIVKYFNWKGITGCGFPAVVKKDVALTAANIDNSWIGVNVAEMISSKTGCPTHVSNDVDAAGWAEMNHGAGKEVPGVVLILALGTGIGSSLFIDGRQVPNTELGHIIMHGNIAEKYAANSVREKKELSWKKWGKRLDQYLNYVESILHPDLIILGGGVSKHHQEFFPYLNCRADLVPAKLRNHAGIVGAACSAKNLEQQIDSTSGLSR
ncbi:MAG: polyphosphate glucokinase [Cyclobacteriaceae bacterium]|nr:MAG: polyphosphate glucokinase [Cyclobacteriaceae bacterium]